MRAVMASGASGAVMAPSPFAVKLSVGGAVGAVMAVNAVMASGTVGANLKLDVRHLEPCC